ncbi:hypothetical protein C8A00DRAFT_14503 [Chaetomidium leptoderma]|uniref:Uncharacterized protein n=1 Tax=Chaetomidium leptoderma TaxID=669021 RepID=A0AAN6VNC6_9PEZI|nr:hypothetical protein C8A00DRAFT_14503 [Chaetomidium leptoderma]
MPQDPNLYGQPPPKRQKKEIVSSTSVAFTSQLSSLLAEPATSTAPSAASATTTAAARTRRAKLKTDELSKTKVKRKDASTTEPKDSKKLSLKSPFGTEESKAEREFARRKMESKARLYAAMQRGDYIGRETGLVDFDRKWAESQAATTNNNNNPASSSDSDPDDDDDETNIDTTLHEHTDEFGRVRHLTHSQILRLQRSNASATELEHMSARPKAPETLIYGDAVQAEAFAARDGADTMEALARKRDRSATPPAATHYRADGEIRTKGVGFYQFSRDEGTREAEMGALAEERRRTEGLRREREAKAEGRKREIEERRRALLERRTKKMAESFLEGLEKDLVGGGPGGG